MLNFTTIPPSFCCLYYSIVCIYVGASRTLNFYNVKKESEAGGDISVNGENSLLSLKSAMSIPVIATGSLLIAYLSIINKITLVNKLLNAYIMFLAVLTMKKYLYPYAQMNSALKAYDFHLQFLQTSRVLALRMTFLEFAVALFSVFLVYTYVDTRYWVANNMIAIGFAISFIENYLVGNIKHIAIIFLGLIAYDVYFVFASEVMITVAQEV
jgi:minor histocompatibility antigen H13